MKALRLLTPAILALLAAPGAAVADGLAGRFSIAFQAGTQSEISGDVTAATEGSLLDKPATILSRSYKDVYHPDLRLQGLLAYGVATKLELVLRGSYYEATNKGLEIGSYDRNQMYGFFGDYKEVGGELVLRYYIAPQSRLKSYMGPVIGLRHVDQVLVSLEVPDAGTAVRNVPFTDSGNLAVFGADLGFAFDLTPHVYLGVDTGLRYQTAPDGLGSLSGLAGYDAGSGRWTAPVSATLGLRF